MDARRESEPTPMKNRTTVERKSERELVVTRTFNGPARIVFEAWTKPELLKRWWAPKSFGVSFLSCEADVRAGGTYRFVFGHPASEQPMAFFGRYIEVTPHSRLVWTNDEGGEGGAVTTVTFEERGGKTLVVMHDLYPSKEALDAAIASGSTGGMWRDVRATGRASRHPGRERGTVMKSSISRSAAWLITKRKSPDEVNERPPTLAWRSALGQHPNGMTAGPVNGHSRKRLVGRYDFLGKSLAVHCVPLCPRA